MAKRAAGRTSGRAPDVGDVAPEVDLPAHDGSRWRLADRRGRPVVLLFHRHLA